MTTGSGGTKLVRRDEGGSDLGEAACGGGDIR